MKQYIFVKFKSLATFALLSIILGGASITGFAQVKKDDPSIPSGLHSPLDEFLIKDTKLPLRLSDVQRTAATIAWATESNLAHDQFNEFKEIVIREWRAGNQETVRFVTEWVAFADKLVTIKKYAEQIALKEKTHPVVVADLKKYPNDPKREIFRRAYRRAHGATSLGSFRAEPKILKTSGTLKDIVGDWAIQSTASATDMKMKKFSFLANGRAIFDEIDTENKSKCFISETKSKEGTVEIIGGEIKIEFPIVKLQTINGCQPSAVASINLPAETSRFTWQIKTDENEMLLLCLTDSNGKSACYQKN